MRRLALVLVVACGTPVAAPVEPEPIAPVAVETPPPDAPRPTFVWTRIVKIDVYDGGLLVTLGAGSARGVTKEWTACLLRGSSDECHPQGTLEILRIEPGWTRTRLTATDVVSGNMSAKLIAPP